MKQLFQPQQYETSNELYEKTGKFTNIWRLNNMLLNNQSVEEEIERNNKYLQTNENRNVIFQNLWDAVKELLGGKFIVINVYLKKQEKPQITQFYTQGTRKKRTSEAQSQ